MARTRTRLAPLLSACLLLAARPARAAPAGRPDGHEGDVRRAAATFEQLERADVEMLSKALDTLVADPTLVKLFVARDREKLYAAAKPIFEKLRREDQITHFYFIAPEPSRVCFLRVHKPEQHGDVVNRETLRAAIATGKIGHGKELGKTAFALRVVKPIVSDGKVVGYMELGEEIDHFFERMKKETGDDFALLVDKQHVDRKELARVRNDDRWDERPDVVLINSTMWDEQQIQLGIPLAKLPVEGTFVGEWRGEATRYVGGAFPVRNASGHVVGALFVRHRVDPAGTGKAPAATRAR